MELPEKAARARAMRAVAKDLDCVAVGSAIADEFGTSSFFRALGGSVWEIYMRI